MRMTQRRGAGAIGHTATVASGASSMEDVFRTRDAFRTRSERRGEVRRPGPGRTPAREAAD